MLELLFSLSVTGSSWNGRLSENQMQCYQYNNNVTTYYYYNIISIIAITDYNCKSLSLLLLLLLSLSLKSWFSIKVFLVAWSLVFW